jgi:hypothetical protein
MELVVAEKARNTVNVAVTEVTTDTNASFGDS